MAYAVGIDLGTTNSVISIFQRGIAETIPVDGRSALPSVVSFRKDGSVLVGQTAKSRLLLDPENTISSAKRHIGDEQHRYHVGNKALTPVDISCLVLKRLVEDANKALGEEIRDAVITVPAYFNEAQREATKKAGKEAGLNVLRLVPEPTAAAVSYGLDKGKDQTIMVYDLGGGTFDVSILEIRGNQFEVKAVGGDSNLGGDDFDQAIMEWISEKISKQTGISIMAEQGHEATMARQRLKEAAESAKIELSQSDRAQIQVPDCLGQPVDLEITLAEYNKMIEPLLQRTVVCMRSVLKDTGLGAEDISRVILVGGSTKNRAVRDIVAKEIKEPYIAERVDEVVAHGAGIIAANLFLPEEDALPIEITDVTGHSLGIDMVDAKRNVYFRPVIPRQTVYPCRMSVLGYTVDPYQEAVQMRVFRGEDEKVDKNSFLGELILEISPPQQEKVPVGAIFELDADGIIHFTAVQLPTGNEASKVVNYAQYHQGSLDLAAIEELVNNGKAKTKSIVIRTRDFSA